MQTLDSFVTVSSQNKENMISDARKAFNSMKENESEVITWKSFEAWYNSSVLGKKRQVPNEGQTVLGSSTKKSKTDDVSDVKGMTKASKMARLKACVSSIKKSVKAEKFYSSYDDTTREITVDISASPSEFAELFGSFGTVPQTDKVSQVVSVRVLTASDLKALFGDLISNLTGNSYSTPRSFQKQYKLGACKVSLNHATLTYSKNTQICKAKISCSNRGDSDEVDGDD